MDFRTLKLFVMFLASLLVGWYLYNLVFFIAFLTFKLVIIAMIASLVFLVIWSVDKVCSKS